MTTTHDIAMLCQCIDAGDDSALMPLADALEDAGDSRAAALRRIVTKGKRPNQDVTDDGEISYWWYHCDGHCGWPCPQNHHVARHVYSRMARPWSYSTRSAAYLALAEALTT